MGQNLDVVIIGGGLIGNSIAAHLANEKLKVAVINSTGLGTPASVAAAGLLTPFELSEIENPLIKDFCFKAFGYFPSFYELIKSSSDFNNIDLGFRQVGSLHLIFSNFEIARQGKEIEKLKNIDPKIVFLNKQEVIKYEPQITKDLIGAYYFPSEALINNPKFLQALSVYCLDRKVTFFNSKAEAINISKNKIENVTLTNNETISAKKYILCNGAWANKFLKEIFKLRQNIIKPIRGELLQIAGNNGLPLQKILFCKDGYILPRLATTQFEKSCLLVGSTFEEVDLDNGQNVFRNTAGGVALLTSLFLRLFPNCKDFSMLNTYVGLRPQTLDKLPILGQVPEVENLYLALGHFRKGILLAPLTGKVLKDLILENTCEHNIELFKFERFLKERSALVC